MTETPTLYNQDEDDFDAIIKATASRAGRDIIDSDDTPRSNTDTDRLASNQELRAGVDSKPETKKPNYTKRRIGALAAGAAVFAGATAGVNEIKNGYESHPVTEFTVTVEDGGTVIEAVNEGVKEFAEANGLVIPVDNITDASNKASAEHKEINNTEYIKPGDQFNVELEKSKFGGYSVDVSPISDVDGTKNSDN